MGSAKKGSFRLNFRGHSGYVLFIYLLIIVLIIASKAISPSFGSLKQVELILIISSLLTLIGFGQGLVILLGELDLSIGSLISFSGVLTAAWLGVNPSIQSFLLILGIMILVGIVNGVGVTILQIPSFIMTLASQMIVIGIALGYTKGTVPGASPHFLEMIMSDRWGGVPIPIIILVVMAILGTIIQQYTRFGRKLYAIGSNRSTSYISGLPVNLLIISAYVISALMAGLTGMLLVGYSGGATLAMGDPYLLPSIAMVVIGGSSILGGSGSFLGTVGASILLTTISTLIQALGINQGWQVFIYGLMILIILGLLRQDLSNYLAKVRKEMMRWNNSMSKQNAR